MDTVDSNDVHAAASMLGMQKREPESKPKLRPKPKPVLERKQAGGKGAGPGGIQLMTPWSPKECQLVLHLVERCGYAWAKMTEHPMLANRTKNMIRNWYLRYVKVAKGGVKGSNRCAVCGQVKLAHICGVPKTVAVEHQAANTQDANTQDANVQTAAMLLAAAVQAA